MMPSMLSGERRFIFNDHVTMRTVVYPSFGSFAASSYRVMLPLDDKLHDISSCQHMSGTFVHDFEDNEGVDATRTTHEGRVVYLYEAKIPVEVHVLEYTDNDVDDLCPLIDRVALVHAGPTLELRAALSKEDADRLLDRMDHLIDAYAQTQSQSPTPLTKKKS